jgi:cytoskeletal protein RodZ
MNLTGQKSRITFLLNQTIYAGIALAMTVGAAGCFYSRTVDTQPPPPPVVQVPASAPVVVQTTPTVPTNPADTQHQVTTSWGPNGTVQKQTTTIAAPNGVPTQKQTTTTWQPNGQMENQTTSTTSTGY